MTDDMDTKSLDAVLHAAKITPPQPDAGFLERMARLAVDHTPVVVTPARPSRWSDFFSVIGGWPAGAGMVCATVAGLLVGISPPEAVLSITTQAFNPAEVWDLSMYSSFDMTLEGDL